MPSFNFCTPVPPAPRQKLALIFSCAVSTSSWTWTRVGLGQRLENETANRPNPSQKIAETPLAEVAVRHRSALTLQLTQLRGGLDAEAIKPPQPLPGLRSER